MAFSLEGRSAEGDVLGPDLVHLPQGLGRLAHSGSEVSPTGGKLDVTLLQLMETGDQLASLSERRSRTERRSWAARSCSR